MLETRILIKNDDTAGMFYYYELNIIFFKQQFKIIDTLVDDFLLTYIVFLPNNKLISVLISYYKMFDHEKSFTYIEHSINNKKKVVEFIKIWCETAKDTFFEDLTIISFLQELLDMLRIDVKIHLNLKTELKTIEMILESYSYS